MGERHPLGNKLTSVQKCIRTGDDRKKLEMKHTTLFLKCLEIGLLGDPKDPNGVGIGYFKKETIEMSLEF